MMLIRLRQLADRRGIEKFSIGSLQRRRARNARAYARQAGAGTMTRFALFISLCMPTKTIIMIGVIIGSTVGGYIPTLFGASLFSMASVIGNTIGGLVGIYVGYKISKF
jgi:hypothetical protein